MKWLFLFAFAFATQSYAQSPVGKSASACAKLRAYVAGQKATDADCVHTGTFNGTDSRLGCYALYFSQTPCGSTVAQDPGAEPQTQGELVFYNAGGTLESVTFDTVYQEGAFAEPAAFGPVQKGSRSGFVVLYRWPQQHAGIQGALYQAVVYLFDTRHGLQIVKNDRLFKSEYDGLQEGKRCVAKYKTLRAIRQKIAASPL